MESEAVVHARHVWKLAVDEYIASNAPALKSFELEQIARLREALEILVQPTPGMGVFAAGHLRASVDAIVARTSKIRTPMNEWIQEAMRHHLYQVVRIRDRIFQGQPKASPQEQRQVVPPPREILDTLQEIQPQALPRTRVETSEVHDEADLFEAGIDELIEDGDRVTPTTVVIDVDEDSKPRR